MLQLYFSGIMMETIVPTKEIKDATNEFLENGHLRKLKWSMIYVLSKTWVLSYLLNYVCNW